MGGLGRLTAWHLPGGPVGSASRWAATYNVVVGQTTYPVNGERIGEKGAKDSRKKEERKGDSGTKKGQRTLA